MSSGKHDIVNAPETGTGGINLDSLADNGGPTQTMALGSDSAAIDYIPISTGLCPSTDQRGFLRPDDGEIACDVGAYESGSALPVTLTVTTAGSGSGTVTSSPAGINCGSTCSSVVQRGHGRDADGDPCRRLDVHRLVGWGLLGHRHLPGDDERGRIGDRDVRRRAD